MPCEHQGLGMERHEIYEMTQTVRHPLIKAHAYPATLTFSVVYHCSFFTEYFIGAVCLFVDLDEGNNTIQRASIVQRVKSKREITHTHS